MRWILGLGFLVHSVAHFVGFVVPWKLAELEESGFVGSEVSFLAKPFRKAGVAQAIRAALDGK